MSKVITAGLALAVGLAAGIPLGGRMMSPGEPEAAATAMAATAAAVPGEVGTQDLFGAYDIVPVDARTSLINNGGVHCVFGIVRAP